MPGIKSIAVFDIGKTNKKLLVFNEQYEIVHEESVRLQDITDEDGFSCEDIDALTAWVKDRFEMLAADHHFNIGAVNFSGYGASMVFLDHEGKLMRPLYNYLKTYPESLNEKFYRDYGGRDVLCRQTASPALGSLNSGLQLYRLKYEKPAIYDQVKYALHLPQYLSYFLSGSLHSELTSIGCHTHLWDFDKNQYHNWVVKEGLAEKFPPIRRADELAGFNKEKIKVGMGLHDSSSALIPYISSFSEPFVLLSTGTWCISLNPFNCDPLKRDELLQDCLCFLSFQGLQVKAARLFAGYEHEQETKRIAEHFNIPVESFASIPFSKGQKEWFVITASGSKSFGARDLTLFENHEEAYYHLIADIVDQQKRSLELVIGDAKHIFVDGGFSRNEVFMHFLAQAFPSIEVYAASVSQASAVGAALVMHDHWNEHDKPSVPEVKRV